MRLYGCSRSMIPVEWNDLEHSLGKDMCRGRDWLMEENWSREQACSSEDCNGERETG